MGSVLGHWARNADRPYGLSDPYRDVRRGLVCQFGINYQAPHLAERRSVYRPDDPKAEEDTQDQSCLPGAIDSHGRLHSRDDAASFHFNGFFPAGAAPALPAKVRHVVLIVKENRSFDDLLGDVTEASNSTVRGNPDHARFGMRGVATKGPGEFAQRNVQVTPNLHAIASRWALGDNFYSDARFDTEGHYWLAGVYPDAWTLASLAPSYAGQKDARPQSRAPGRRLFFQGTTEPTPEQYPEAGTLWHHLARHEIPFRRFDEGCGSR